jgi:Lar family restriction alleviation protein
MNKIKPCPFCRLSNVKVDRWVAGWSYYNYISYFVYCNDCKASGPRSDGIDEDSTTDAINKQKQIAIERWNNRG